MLRRRASRILLTIKLESGGLTRKVDGQWLEPMIIDHFEVQSEMTSRFVESQT
jgi:hypothetical protein